MSQTHFFSDRQNKNQPRWLANFKVVFEKRFELLTLRLEGACSIQLSYSNKTTLRT